MAIKIRLGIWKLKVPTKFRIGKWKLKVPRWILVLLMALLPDVHTLKKKIKK